MRVQVQLIPNYELEGFCQRFRTDKLTKSISHLVQYYVYVPSSFPRMAGPLRDSAMSCWSQVWGHAEKLYVRLSMSLYYGLCVQCHWIEVRMVRRYMKYIDAFPNYQHQ